MTLPFSKRERSQEICGFHFVEAFYQGRSTVTYDVVLTRKQSSVRSNFRIYGQKIPRTGELIVLPVDGHKIKARVDRIVPLSSTVVDHVNVTEI
jgi:hypothetical protein